MQRFVLLYHPNGQFLQRLHHVTPVMTNRTKLETVLKLNIPNKLYYHHDEIISPRLETPPSAPVQNEAGTGRGGEIVCVRVFDSRQSG